MSERVMMRVFWLKLLTVAALLAVALVTTTAQQTAGKCHVLLLDVSGSMQKRYANNLRGWLIEKLLTSAAFSPGDRVIVREFNDQGGTTFDANDPLRKYNGTFNAPQILASVPQHVTRFDTDIPKAIEQTLADIRGLPVAGDVLIWLVTDNVQDAGGSMSIDPLYQKIVGEKNFRAAYLFPLTTENGVTLGPDEDAMVMYLLHYAPQKSALATNRFADDAGNKIGNPPITWYPFEEYIHLDQANIKVNGEAAQIIDGKLALPAIPEGVPPEYTLEFRLNSQLRGREILSGKIANPTVVLARLPESLEGDGDLDKWTMEITPRTLAMKAKQSTTGNYSATVKAAGTFHPSSFWHAVFNSTSEPVDAQLQLAPVDVKTRMDLPLLSRVKNLRGIETVLQQGQSGPSVIRLPMTFQVEYSTLWRRLLVALLALAAVGSVATATGALLVKTTYQLTTPLGERLLKLPLVGSQTLTIRDDRVAVLSKRFGALTVAPASGYLLDGAVAPRRLADGEEQFTLTSQTDGSRYPYAIHRVTRQKPEPAARDTILD
jgi:hypothetical protein